ncbi:MAG: hypothetical protein WCD72_02330 [Dehalococcoidia bacterium]
MRSTIVLLLALLLFVSGCTWLPATTPQSAFLPKILQFDAKPSVINQGEASYLRWSISEANSVSIDNGIGNVALAGEIPVSPNSTTFYTLTAKNLAGEASARTQIIVEGGPTTQPVTPPTMAPTIVSFYADRLIITPGQYVTLSWEVLGTTEVTLTPIGQVKAKDTITLQPASTTTYVLAATNSAGTSTAGITVTVQSSLSAGTSAEKAVILRPVPQESGSLIRGAGYLDYAIYAGVCAGDTLSNSASRAFLSFDISSIPANAIIKEAILDLSNYSVYGSPTYMRSSWGNMGALEVYHLQYTDLNYKAYIEMAMLVANGEFINYPLSLWAWDVKDSNDGEPVIQGLIQQGKSRCQFRIQFFTTTNWDSISDMLCFDNATLTIKYVTTE